jgi:TonB-linked SusC/RagA family outer membrane protein
MKKLKEIMLLSMVVLPGLIWAQTKTISGVVTEAANGEPMPGVTVMIKGTTVGTITMIDGTYNLSVPDDTDTLQYSFIGYVTRLHALNGQTTLNVRMQVEATDIDEVVVTGYGIKKKGTYTGSVEVVDAKKIEQVPVGSFDQVLQGQAPGLLSVGSSGAPGSAATIRIRGLSSISSGNDPLFIMDGIPITAGQFSALNQNDIENISILKDATATSLYGSRASNGVIVITTKRGRESERAQIQYRGQYGINLIANDNFNMMNTEQKIRYEEETGTKEYTPEEKLELMKINTNWLDVVLRDAATTTHEVSARGGNERTKYYLSGSYFLQDGIQYRSDFERYNLRINMDNQFSPKTVLGTNFTLGYETKSHTVTDGTNVYNPIFSARLLNPYLKPYKEDGSYNKEGLPWSNPIEQLELNDSSNDRLKIVGGVFLDIDLFPNLKFKTNWGVDFYDYTQKRYLNPDSDWGAGPNGQVYRSFARNFRLTPTNTLNYQLNINDSHDFSVLLGQELIVNHYQSFNVEAMNIPNNKLKVLDVTSEINNWGGNNQDYNVASFFANMAYSYQYKYMADLSLRRDGSSRFGKNSRWGTFWSAGIGWNMQEEAFLKSIDWIDQLKLRASIGETGNYLIGNYAHQALFGYGTYMNNSAAVFTQYSNDNLTWEKKLKANLALEMRFLRRYMMKLDVYDELTSDMLFYVPVSPTSGVDGRMENIGEMSNRGIELEVNADLLNTNDFKISVNANMAYNKNEVTKLYDDLEEIDEITTLIKVGESYGTFYQVQWAGVDASNGKGLWYTADGEITNRYSDSDRVLQTGKSYLPPLTGGFTGNFSYKNLQLTAFFSWMADKWMVNNTRYFIESQGMFAAYNQSVEMLNYWKQPGDEVPHPDPKYQDNQFDTRLLENASFLRLKNLTLAYNFNSRLVEKSLLFKTARVYAQGQNLLTFTGYTGIDPEYYGRNEVNMYPHTKTISFGIDLGF